MVIPNVSVISNLSAFCYCYAIPELGSLIGIFGCFWFVYLLHFLAIGILHFVGGGPLGSRKKEIGENGRGERGEGSAVNTKALDRRTYGKSRCGGVNTT